MNKKVLVINGSSYYKPFKHVGSLVTNPSILDTDPKSVALVVFTGGEDVTPSYYGEKKDPRTYNNPERDAHEKAIFDKAKSLGLPMFGICRGSQFLCAMAGGKLHQHVEGHGGTHGLRIHDGRLIEVNSTHHQMQIPPEGAEVLAWCEPAIWGQGADGRDIECVYYPNINAVGAQYHPEWLHEESDGYKYAVELTNWLLAKQNGDQVIVG
jgi:gamma-glutamyl-gamma-aminobutyrate hydrolase PuuD